MTWVTIPFKYMFAESFSFTPSGEPPTMYTLDLDAPRGTKKTEWAPAPDYTRPIPLTASICLDSCLRRIGIETRAYSCSSTYLACISWLCHVAASETTCRWNWQHGFVGHTSGRWVMGMEDRCSVALWRTAHYIWYGDLFGLLFLSWWFICPSKFGAASMMKLSRSWSSPSRPQMEQANGEIENLIDVWYDHFVSLLFLAFVSSKVPVFAQ